MADDIWRGGAARRHNNQARGFYDPAAGRLDDPEYIDMMAAAAEDLVRRTLGLPRPRETQTPDRGWDDVLHDGRTSDTKWTKYPHGMLVCAQAAKSTADVYIGVVGPTVEALRITGYATADELKRPENIRMMAGTKGQTPTWALSQDRLHAVTDLDAQPETRAPEATIDEWPDGINPWLPADRRAELARERGV